MTQVTRVLEHMARVRVTLLAAVACDVTVGTHNARVCVIANVTALHHRSSVPVSQCADNQTKRLILLISPMRPYSTVVKECDAAYAAYSTLYKEKDTHPEAKALAALKQRQRLENALPPSLHKLLLDNLGLTDFACDCELDENKQGEPARMWKFSATFTDANDNYDCEVDPKAYDDEDDEPIFVIWRGNSKRLWADALAENATVGQALAAFCYACCEHLRDWDAYPSKAFKVPKGKVLAVGETALV